ncbi:hypothetical protein LMG28688_06601 [Paraburkholderia caffeinitolerans]|uniref:site-specific DNA-methyltransferase (adenine-specific) n=3 Tax=Paraburkholderia caffeinitolerans TaxID=1723730 RepID=A0A6J5GYP4_9BURK|nr:hypothetical protein LMG28688_06601 [Paraburkholderia caffeinitolerans]
MTAVEQPLQIFQLAHWLVIVKSSRLTDRRFGIAPQPHIQTGDALITADGSTAQWPDADVVIGNPPFIGNKKMRGRLGAAYVEALRKAYEGRVPGGADLVCYWFDKANDLISAGQLQRAGLVATNSIRGGRNRQVLQQVCDSARIFNAWSDEAWINEGAAVRVSLICFGLSSIPAVLDGLPAGTIFPDLTSAGEVTRENADLTRARPLAENAGVAFSGITKKGAFDIDGKCARQMLLESGNPNGRHNSDVLSPWKNGEAIVNRDPDKWIINFGERSEVDASLYPGPFTVVENHVKPARSTSNAKGERENWWKLARRAPDMFAAIQGHHRFIVTPEVSKHRIFAWLSPGTVPDKNLVVIARDDLVTFGVLHSRLHELWALRMGTSLEDRPRYTSSTTFRTFPFPPGLTLEDTAYQQTAVLPDGTLIPANLPVGIRRHAAAIARAAKRLDELRQAWLNPPEWTKRVPEVVPMGMKTSPYPDRIEAKPGCEKDLAKRTLTNLYNERPAWLDTTHKDLDKAVASSYGWTDYTPAMRDEEILSRLLTLNLEQSKSTD